MKAFEGHARKRGSDCVIAGWCSYVCFPGLGVRVVWKLHTGAHKSEHPSEHASVQVTIASEGPPDKKTNGNPLDDATEQMHIHCNMPPNDHWTLPLKSAMISEAPISAVLYFAPKGCSRPVHPPRKLMNLRISRKPSPRSSG